MAYVKMTYFKRTFEMTNEDLNRLEKVNGKIMRGIVERKHTLDIAKELKMHPYQIDYNIDEMLYELRKHVGLKRYLKMIFVK